jgi:DNA-binding CsgD family transcriptional regulator
MWSMSVPARVRPASWDSLFEEAALDPSKWLVALEEFARATGSTRAELVGAGSEPGTSFSWVTSIDDRTMQDFLVSGGHSPDTNFRFAADDGRSVLEIVDERRYDEAKRSLANTDFVDFCEQYGMVHGCQTVLLRERDGFIGMSVLRTRGDGRTSERDQRIFADGAAAAARAVRLQRAVEEQGRHLLAGTFEAMSTPCVLIDAFGCVRSVSSAAQRFLIDQDLVTVREGRLGSSDPLLDSEIAQAVRAAVAPAPARYARLVAGKAAANPLLIEIFALARAAWSLPFAISALAVIRSPGKLPFDAPQRLIRAFGLTAAEADVALLLCQGRPREEIAAHRRVSSETLRSQIRSIYSKLGCNREAELIILARSVLD